ncbi:MAG: molybdopterin-dependent oxidoreductase, partial [Chloroflexi bacterium]|nr:molybdopterin-dependent oxidoreductase [Chloroflexota bacterium]
ERIAGLAREYASAKPAALVPGWGHQRTAFGEQPSRLCIALAGMTGNVGISGGNAAGHYMMRSYARRPVGKIPTGKNPAGVTIAINKWADAVLEGKAGGYESDIKMVYVSGRNILNQFGNVAKSVAAMRKLEFVVVHEQFMTPTARFADIALPITTWFEREDIVVARDYAIYMSKVIEPMYECKSDLQIFTELAGRLGVSGYNDKTDVEWLRSFTEGSDIEDFERFQREGVFYFERIQPYVAFRQQIEDPEHHPFNTPSGKIELYSPRLEAIGKPDTVPSIPKYVRPWESRDDPLAQEFPLQIITPHCKKFTHSTLTNLPWLQELEPHAVWMSAADAASRRIADGELVKVFNGRGEVHLPAKVTERIMPGVVCIYQGIWYAPDGQGVDLSGCANVLTRDEDTPVADGATTHSCLVEVERL